MTKRRINPKTGLTDLQQRFCHEFVIDNNATQAMLRAGTTGNTKTAGNQGHKLLSLAKIKDYISNLQLGSQERTDITADKVLTEIGRLAFINIADYCSWDARGNVVMVPSEVLERYQSAGIASIKQTVKQYKRGGELITETQIDFKLCKKEEMLRLAYHHLGLDKEIEKDRRKDLDRLLQDAHIKVQEKVKLAVVKGDK